MGINQTDGRYEIGVDNPPEKSKAWCGASGAPIFVGDALVGLVQARMPGLERGAGFAGRLWVMPIAELEKNASVKKCLDSARKYTSVDAHRLDLRLCLKDDNYWRGLWAWLDEEVPEKNNGPIASLVDIDDLLEKWQKVPLRKYLLCAKYLVSCLEDAGVEIVLASDVAERLLFNLIPLHSEAVARGRQDIDHELRDAQRVGGPIQVQLEENVLKPLRRIKISKGFGGICQAVVDEAMRDHILQGIARWIGCSHEEAKEYIQNRANLYHYMVIESVRSSRNADENALEIISGEVKNGVERFEAQVDWLRKRKNPKISVHDVERPLYFCFEEGLLSPEAQSYIENELRCGVYEYYRARSGTSIIANENDLHSLIVGMLNDLKKLKIVSVSGE